MQIYKTPDCYYFRLHHPRPRFKNDIENVLVYIASEITKIGKKTAEDFNNDLNSAIRRFPGNLNKSEKTINNWRTEIDALFCFIEKEGCYLKPSRISKELASSQDLVKFFKVFCYHFRYPGGFLKPYMNFELLKNKIDFHPAIYILRMMDYAERHYDIRAGLRKTEVTHCIFNDLRVTRDGRSVKDTWDIIVENRKNNMKYDWSGDITRYAGDILDYMTQANLLIKRPDGKYYINHIEDIAVQRFLNPTDDLFNFYDHLSSLENIQKDDVKQIRTQWVDYFNTQREDSFFDTDIIALMTDNSEEYHEIKKLTNLDELIENDTLSTTGEIGSVGESLILNHEKQRISNEGRPDLEYLIKLIPSMYAVGYDINSREVNEKHKLIEVKTTASSNHISFFRFHLTPNEWTAAESLKDRYFVFRLMVTKQGTKLFVIQNPVDEYKKDRLSASPRDGMDIYFDPDKCGEEIQLII